MLFYGFGLMFSDDNVLSDMLNIEIRVSIDRNKLMEILKGLVEVFWVLWFYFGDDFLVVNVSMYIVGVIIYCMVDKEV